MEAPSTNNDVLSQRAKLYIQQRGFAFAATRAYKATNKDTHDANDILRELKGYRCALYSARYASFINTFKLQRSLRSLKLFFLELEAGLMEPVLPDDEDTVVITLETIYYKEAEQVKRKRKHYSPPHRNQRCNKRVPLLPTPLQAQYAGNTAQLSTNMSFNPGVDWVKMAEMPTGPASTVTTGESLQRYGCWVNKNRNRVRGRSTITNFRNKEYRAFVKKCIEGELDFGIIKSVRRICCKKSKAAKTRAEEIF